jgi:hypothetical protein
VVWRASNWRCGLGWGVRREKGKIRESENKRIFNAKAQRQHNPKSLLFSSFLFALLKSDIKQSNLFPSYEMKTLLARNLARAKKTRP